MRREEHTLLGSGGMGGGEVGKKVASPSRRIRVGVCAAVVELELNFGIKG